ncbi:MULTISPECIES: hypothetical protein [Prosthecochloris]|uniref:Uncharacterized protein n=1 Tax=Prosthecochloris vibrioformis TaxID=1098 RepID=A0A5C4S177_PROVB|nr:MULTISPECIES: hypothetical protein [Prosthecochloris]ANT65121.1 hypothetical protein Ptc2401_01351 [Prosthecochloris sp. CIB 2401]TNJ36837.1 hypothetical protein FGF68_04425 [Prosthecochloris vibrioformis]
MKQAHDFLGDFPGLEGNPNPKCGIGLPDRCGEVVRALVEEAFAEVKSVRVLVFEPLDDAARG